MGSWRFRKPEPVEVCGLCVNCGRNKQKRKPSGKYHAICSPCDKRVNLERKHAHRSLIGNNCSRCGFSAEHICQLDVDHINGDHSDNSHGNLQTLCANCHRLKTFQNREFHKKTPH